MKKKLIHCCVIILLVSISVALLHRTSAYESFIKGRWKTVGCNSDNFSEWRTYCCPNDAYDNCNGRVGTCPHYPYNGCQDTFWSR